VARYRFYTADVFTDEVFGGNPLAVFPDARGLDSQRMQRIAREMNLSETVFVQPPSAAAFDRKLRIFTPANELPFAGHPTVGAACVLAATGEFGPETDTRQVVFEEGVGRVPVWIRRQQGRPAFAQFVIEHPPEFGPDPPPMPELASVLSLQPWDLADDTPEPKAISSGVPFLFIPVKNREALRRARVHHERWERLLSASWAPSLYVFTFDAERSDAQVRARMFAPGLGVPEDPATGSAAAALAGYLALMQRGRTGPMRWVIEQGCEMGRPSRIELEADLVAGFVATIRVGGTSVMVSEGWMNVN